MAMNAPGSSIHETLRDANGRPWPAGQAPARPSTEATTVASTARADGETGGTVDPNERVRAQLVAQGKILEEEVSTRGQGRPERRDRPEGVTHRL